MPDLTTLQWIKEFMNTVIHIPYLIYKEQPFLPIGLDKRNKKSNKTTLSKIRVKQNSRYASPMQKI